MRSNSHRRRTALDEAASKLQFATARLRTLDQLTKKPERRASPCVGGCFLAIDFEISAPVGQGACSELRSRETSGGKSLQ